VTVLVAALAVDADAAPTAAPPVTHAATATSPLSLAFAAAIFVSVRSCSGRFGSALAHAQPQQDENRGVTQSHATPATAAFTHLTVLSLHPQSRRQNHPTLLRACAGDERGVVQ
jgi:hypothetical protein